MVTNFGRIQPIHCAGKEISWWWSSSARWFFMGRPTTTLAGADPAQPVPRASFMHCRNWYSVLLKSTKEMGLTPRAWGAPAWGLDPPLHVGQELVPCCACVLGGLIGTGEEPMVGHQETRSMRGVDGGAREQGMWQSWRGRGAFVRDLVFF